MEPIKIIIVNRIKRNWLFHHLELQLIIKNNTKNYMILLGDQKIDNSTHIYELWKSHIQNNLLTLNAY